MASPAGISDQKIEARKPRLDLAKAHKLPAAPWLLSALSGFEPVTAPLIRGLGSVAAADWQPEPTLTLIGAPAYRWSADLPTTVADGGCPLQSTRARGLPELLKKPVILPSHARSQAPPTTPSRVQSEKPLPPPGLLMA